MKMLFSILVCSLLLSTSAPSFCYTREFNRAEATPEQLKYLETLLKRVSDNWHPVRIDEGSFSPEPEISFVIQSDGQITDLTVTRTTGIELIDLTCLDALSSASPAPPPTAFKESPYGLTEPLIYCDFNLLQEDKSGKWAATGAPPGHTEMKFSSHDKFPELYNPLVPAHKAEPFFSFVIIPTDIAKRWPGLLSESELFAKDNYGQLKLTCAKTVLANIRQSWTEFCLTSKHPTKADVLKKREDLKVAYAPWLQRAQSTASVRQYFGACSNNAEKTKAVSEYKK